MVNSSIFLGVGLRLIDSEILRACSLVGVGFSEPASSRISDFSVSFEFVK